MRRLAPCARRLPQADIDALGGAIRRPVPTGSERLTVTYLIHEDPLARVWLAHMPVWILEYEPR